MIFWSVDVSLHNFDQNVVVNIGEKLSNATLQNPNGASVIFRNLSWQMNTSDSSLGGFPIKAAGI